MLEIYEDMNADTQALITTLFTSLIKTVTNSFPTAAGFILSLCLHSLITIGDAHHKKGLLSLLATEIDIVTQSPATVDIFGHYVSQEVSALVLMNPKANLCDSIALMDTFERNLDKTKLRTSTWTLLQLASNQHMFPPRVKEYWMTSLSRNSCLKSLLILASAKDTIVSTNICQLLTLLAKHDQIDWQQNPEYLHYLLLETEEFSTFVPFIQSQTAESVVWHMLTKLISPASSEGTYIDR
jgi:hypothetical protein